MSPLASMFLVVGWLAATMVLWGFAFFSMPESTPEWMLQAQTACFGRTESGLPEPYGWTVLIGSPLSLLLALTLVYRDELKNGGAALYGSWLGKAAILLCVLGVSTQAVWVTERVTVGLALARADYGSGNTESLPEHYLRTQDPAFNFRLRDPHGDVTGPENFKGRPLILTFAFSHCTTVCPALLNDLKEASEELDDNTPMLVVSLDPWRDRQTEMTSFAGKWEMGPSTRFYTGEIEEVLNVLREYKVPISRNEQNGDVYHPPMVYVLDAQGRIAYTFNSPGVQWLTDAVRRLESEN